MREEQARRALSSIRCFLLDMDGTFYLGERLLAGSLDFLRALRETGREALFLTNNSSRSGAYYLQKLERMGVRAPFLRVLTSGQAAARYALNAFPGKSAFVLGNGMLRAELAASGLALDDARPDYVLAAYDTELTYEKLRAACDFVRAGLPYIATHPDLNCPTENGFAPDIGAIIAFIRASTGREPDAIVGKPHAIIVREALRETGFEAAQTALAGDRLYTDIAAAARAGMTSVLVLSGETKRADLAAAPVKPDLVFERLGDIVPYLQ